MDSKSYCVDKFEDKFEEGDTFKDYHYYELYDEKKEYNKETFEHDYGKGVYNYRYCKHRLLVNDDKKEYVVAEQQLTEKELTLYTPHCQCPKCTAPWYSSWTYCGCCYGCLRSPFPQQWVINKTINHYQTIYTVIILQNYGL